MDKLVDAYNNANDKKTLYVGTVKSTKDRYLEFTYLLDYACHIYGALLEESENNYMCFKKK